MIAGEASWGRIGARAIFFFSIETSPSTLSNVRDFRAYYSKKRMLAAATRDWRTGVFLKFEECISKWGRRI